MNRMTWLSAILAASIGTAASASVVIPAWPLPPIRYGSAPKLPTAIKSSGLDFTTKAHVSSRATPMLDQFFASSSSGMPTEHRRSAATTLGNIDLSLQALRQRVIKDVPTFTDHGTASKLWSAGVQLGWMTGTDHLWTGIADARRTFAQSGALAGLGHQTDTETAIGGGWQHGDHLRLTVDWLHMSGKTGLNGAERIAQLAEGASLHESGYRAMIGWTVSGDMAGSGSIFGIEARSARLARDDAQWLGTNRPDTRLGLFLRTSF